MMHRGTGLPEGSAMQESRREFVQLLAAAGVCGLATRVAAISLPDALHVALGLERRERVLASSGERYTMPRMTGAVTWAR